VRGNGWEGSEREGREEGTGRGPQFEKNDPHHQMAVTDLSLVIARPRFKISSLNLAIRQRYIQHDIIMT